VLAATVHLVDGVEKGKLDAELPQLVGMPIPRLTAWQLVADPYAHILSGSSGRRE